MGRLTAALLHVVRAAPDCQRELRVIICPSDGATLLRFLDFPHVPMVHDGDLTIIPGDRDRIPTRFGYFSAISGIASPANAAALLEGLGFGDIHSALLPKKAPGFEWCSICLASGLR